MLAGIVMEGKRDFPVLKAALLAVCSEIEAVIPIYPPRDEILQGLYRQEGVAGTGWTGVKQWCKRYGLEMYEFMESYGEPLDLLVLQVDATIAHNSALNLKQQPCPPASDTTNDLHALVIDWLGGTCPAAVVITVPSKIPDAWVCAALLPEAQTTNLECDTEPLERLTDFSIFQLGFKLKRRTGGQLKPTTRQYQQHLAPKVQTNFEQVYHICGEAKRFAHDLTQSMTDIEKNYT